MIRVMGSGFATGFIIGVVWGKRADSKMEAVTASKFDSYKLCKEFMDTHQVAFPRNKFALKQTCADIIRRTQPNTLFQYGSQYRPN